MKTTLYTLHNNQLCISTPQKRKKSSTLIVLL